MSLRVPAAWRNRAGFSLGTAALCAPLVALYLLETGTRDLLPLIGITALALLPASVYAAALWPRGRRTAGVMAARGLLLALGLAWMAALAVTATTGLFTLPDRSLWASVAFFMVASLFTVMLGMAVSLGLPIWIAMGWAWLFRE